MRKLFVSYARENKADVDQLVAHLGTMGYDTWVDEALRGGQDWWDEILDRITDTDVVIAIYSAAALNSTACGREFEWAVALGKPVVPVAVEPRPTALPSRFARRQIIDYSEPAERAFAALKLQGALATLPSAPPLPDPLPEPPKAPLSYLTDLIDLITQASALDHDQQHQILLQLEPALSALDPLERRGGRDILERFSARRDLYADVDRAITRLRQLPTQPVPVDSEPSTQNTASAAEQSEAQVDAGEPIGATTAAPPHGPASTPEAELTHQDEPALESDDVAADLAATSAPGSPALVSADSTVQPAAESDQPPDSRTLTTALTSDTTPSQPPQAFTQNSVSTPAPVQRATGDSAARASEPETRTADRRAPVIAWWQHQRRQVQLGLIAALVVILAAAGITAGYLLWPNASRQTVLPFTGLHHPRGVAADSAGNVYVADADNNRVVKLLAGSPTQSVLPFTGLGGPAGVAVDAAGDIYVVDDGNNRVVKLAAGSDTQSVLPFTGLDQPDSVAVDTAGSVYVAAFGNDRVVKLAAGSDTQSVLPFSSLGGPMGVAVDTAGTVYVTDQTNNRVVKLASGSSTQTELPFTGLSQPRAVAVDTAGNLYVADSDSNRVVKLASGSSTQTVLPFTDLKSPDSVAVDSAGNVYVTDYDNNRVLKLSAE